MPTMHDKFFNNNYVIFCINIDIQLIQNHKVHRQTNYQMHLLLFTNLFMLQTWWWYCMSKRTNEHHSLTHSLTAALDQLRVVASSTIYGHSSWAEQLQQIRQCLPLFVGAMILYGRVQSAAARGYGSSWTSANAELLVKQRVDGKCHQIQNEVWRAMRYGTHGRSGNFVLSLTAVLVTIVLFHIRDTTLWLHMERLDTVTVCFPQSPCFRAI